jgi:sugar phosphate isomerase/epimerase
VEVYNVDKIGLQLYSVKELTEKDFFGTMEYVSEIGYDGVEFAGFFDMPSEKVSGKLKELGLQACGSHTGISLLMNKLEEVIEYNLGIGNKYVVCPGLPEDMRNSEESWLKTAELFNNIGRKCKENGLMLGYHNHDFEFEVFNGKYGFDILGMNTEPDLVFLEIDTFWVEYVGLRSVDFMRKYSDRLPLIHIKDLKSLEDKISTEIGKGIMDFVEITKLAKELDTKWYIVEQEEFDIPQKDSIKQSVDYLKTIL